MFLGIKRRGWMGGSYQRRRRPLKQFRCTDCEHTERFRTRAGRLVAKLAMWWHVRERCTWEA